MTTLRGMPFRLGIDSLSRDYPEWLYGRRIGLVSHAAAVDAGCVTSAEKLHGTPGVNLAALFGPEHGYAGLAAAGDSTNDAWHAEWGIPIYSLYGETRKPTVSMLEEIDTLIVEFQDLGARPYTYVSTLRLVLEAAAEWGKTVVIADRPVPLPLGVDGPVLDPALETFVGYIPGPMQYGLTQGETAGWLTATLGLDLDLRIAPMQGYHREAVRQPSWPEWVPPSPRIRTWEQACLFTCTVFGEALPSLDYGSGTSQSFQLLGAPWLDAARLSKWLERTSVPGLGLQPVRYQARSGLYAGAELDGLQLAITDYSRFKPVAAGVTLLSGIGALYGTARIWEAPGTRPEWFDKLFGTDSVRLALQSGTPAADIIESWQPALDGFLAQRKPHLLYS